MHRGRSVVGCVLAALCAVALSGCTREGPRHRAISEVPFGTAWGDVGRMIDIGGRRLYLECRGTGRPTVILESRYVDAGDIWSLAQAHPPAVQPGMAEVTRVCVYDRAGARRSVSPRLVHSDPAPMPRTAADVVADLHALLAAARLPGPYVLVGHALGGLFVRLYASIYPNDVAGMVLVEATSETLRDRLEPRHWNVLRKLLLAGTIPGVAWTPNLETYDLDASVAQIRAAPPLRPMPLVVLSAARPNLLPDSLPSEAALELVFATEPAWREAQDDLARLVPGARHITAPTGHYVQVERPDLVIDAIRQVAGLPAALGRR
jgi:pimeloyl-ACP methyl ester carboxylesterase